MHRLLRRGEGPAVLPEGKPPLNRSRILIHAQCREEYRCLGKTLVSGDYALAAALAVQWVPRYREPNLLGDAPK